MKNSVDLEDTSNRRPSINEEDKGEMENKSEKNEEIKNNEEDEFELEEENDSKAVKEENAMGENFLAGEIDRNVYLDDCYVDEREKKECWKKYFGKMKKGSLRGAVLAFASIVFGVSGLAFPKGLNNMGLVPSLIFFVIVVAIIYWTMKIFIDTARKKKLLNFGLLVKVCLGDKMAFATELTNIAFCIGILMSYNLTISNFFFEVIVIIFKGYKETIKNNQKTIRIYEIIVSMFFLQLPLSLLKDMSALQYVALGECFTLIYCTILITIQCPSFYMQAGENRKIPWFKNLSMDIFETFSIFVYGLASHNGIMPVFDELARPSKRRTRNVLNRALMLDVGLFLTIGIAGFFSLIPGGPPSLFISRKDLKEPDYFVFGAKCCYLITLHCCTAINNNIIRNSVKSLWFDGKNLPFKWDFIGIFLLLLFSNIGAYFLDDIVQIIDTIGGISCVFICFIVPVLCWVKTNGKPLYHYQNVLSIILLVILSIFGTVSVVYSIYNEIKKKNKN